MKVFWISLTVLVVLLGSALCNECVNNFTSLQDIAQDPSSLMNITLLPRGDERDDFNAFPFRLWVFPNMRFGCSGNLSRILVRTNARLRENRTAPKVATWKETAIGIYIIVDVPYPDGVVSSSLDMIEYLFNPPLLVMDSQLVGFVFSDTNDQLSLPIAFQDVGANNAPASVHVSALNPQNNFIQVLQPVDPFTRENFRFVPLIAVQFVEDPVITTPPPMTVPMTTTPSPSTPGTTTDPPLDVEVDVGLYAGIAVAFLLVIVIVLLAVIIAIVVRRKKAQQNIYEVPVEPTPPNLENPVCREEVIELDSQTQQTEMMTSNPSYMPNTDASINYEGEMYSYIDPEDVRILARNPIVSQDEIKTDQVATSSNIATADNICYGSAIPRDHSYQVTTSDNVAYGSTVR